MPDNNKNENDLLSIGEAHFNKGEYEEAIKVLSELVKLNPNNEDAWNYLNSIGLSYFECREYEKAIETLLKLLKLNPNNEMVGGYYNIIGLSYFEKGQYKEAIEFLVKGIELIPIEPNSEFENNLYILGYSYFETKQYNKAIEYLLKAIELKPNDANTWDLLGMSYIENREYKEALKCFIKANKGWVEFHIEFSNKLLAYKNNRKKLIEIIKSIFTDIKIKIPEIMNEKDIDPFTVFGLFNNYVLLYNKKFGKGLKKLDILAGIKDKFKINSKFSEISDNTIPTVKSMNDAFFNPSEESKNKDIENLWNIFEVAINYADNNTAEYREAFIKAFDLVKGIKGNKWKLTIGLYWIRPLNYAELFTESRKFIIQNNIIPDYAKYLLDANKSMINGEEYLTICDKLIEAINNNNYEFKDLSELQLHAYFTINVIQKNTDNVNNDDKEEYDLLSIREDNFNNGKYEKAIQSLSKAVKLNPKNYVCWHYLGYSYQGKKLYRKAAAAFIRANEGWIKFYTEFANKLLAYKNNRKELIEIIKSIFIDINIKAPKIFNEDDIDPFTIFGLFNKGLSNRRTKILKNIANKFKINYKIPKSFYFCIPLHRNFNSNFYNPLQNVKSDIENLWNIFEAAINYADNNTNENREAFIKYYDLAKDIKGNKWKLTMGLCWIRPFNYVSLDPYDIELIIKDNIIPAEYIKYIKKPDNSIPNGEEYLLICDKLLEAIKSGNYEFKNFYELSDYALYVVCMTRNNKEGNTMNIENNSINFNKKYDKNKFLQEVYITEEEYNKLVKLIKDKKNIILQGSAGVGKSYAAKRLAYSIIGEKDNERVKMIQFHQSYSYEDFIMGYRPKKDKDGFELKEGVFYKFCKEAEEDGRDYFLIIDEINRGNISKIFGELFMLIEEDKRKEEYALELVYKDDKKFFVPKNLYIIGLMNTADRNLAMLDYALRRRFAFYDMKPAFDSAQFKDYQNKLNNNKFNSLIEKVKELNEVIKHDGSLGEGFCIGHSYFCNLENIKDDKLLLDKLSLIIEFELIPLLKEYWFDDKEKVNTWIKNLTDAIK